jgi:hypothetical protein
MVTRRTSLPIISPLRRRFEWVVSKTSDCTRQHRESCLDFGVDECRSDPNPKFSVEMWQKSPRTEESKKPRDGGSDGAKRKNPRSNHGDQTKEGRRVGLDVHDLLIEALIDPVAVGDAEVEASDFQAINRPEGGVTAPGG